MPKQFRGSIQMMNILAKAIIWSIITFGIGANTFARAEEVIQRYENMTLNGMLELADGKTITDGIILITHSILQHNRHEPIPYVQELLKENGYSSLAINYSLELNNRHGPLDCQSQHRHTLGKSLAEIGGWIAWLKEKGARKLILLGHSYGANEVARYGASNDEDAIRGIILLGGGTADHRAWSPGGYKIQYGKELNDPLERAELLAASGKGSTLMENVDFLFCPKTSVSAASFVSYYRVDPERLLPNLMKGAKKPMLFVAAGEDNRMSDLNRLVKPFVDGKKTQLVVIEGAGHFFLDLFADDAVEQIVAFFQEIKF